MKTLNVNQRKAKARKWQEQEMKQQQNSKYSPKLRKLFSFGWKIFAAFAIILGVYSAVHPKISVVPSTYLDPSDPLKALFDVTNDGLLPLHNIKPSCAINRIVIANGARIIGSPNYGSHLYNPSHFSKELAPGETDTVFCPLGALKMPAPVVSAEIAIVIDYSFIGIHWPSKIYIFTTQNDINGQLHWIKHPLKK